MNHILDNPKKLIPLFVAFLGVYLIIFSFYFIAYALTANPSSNFTACTGGVSLNSCYDVGSVTPRLNWTYTGAGGQVQYCLTIFSDLAYSVKVYDPGCINSSNLYHDVPASGGLQVNTIYYWGLYVVDDKSSVTDFIVGDGGFTALGCIPTLNVSLSVSPSSGAAPLNTTFQATTSGSALGTINYSFWWDCANATTNVSTAEAICGNLPNPSAGSCSENANGRKCEAVGPASGDHIQNFSHTYDFSASTSSAKVIVERGSASSDEDMTFVNTSCNPVCGWGACTNTPSCDTGSQDCTDPNACEFGQSQNCLVPGANFCPDFDLISSNDFFMTIVKGGGETDTDLTNITVIPFPASPDPNIWDSSVQLSVDDWGGLSGATGHFSDSTLTPAEYGVGSQFWITVPNSATGGSYTIRIKGRSGIDPIVSWLERYQNINFNLEEKDPFFI